MGCAGSKTLFVGGKEDFQSATEVKQGPNNPTKFNTVEIPREHQLFKKHKDDNGKDVPVIASAEYITEGVIYRAKFPYQAKATLDMSVRRFDLVLVKNTSHDTWWYGRLGDDQGYVPSTYLEKRHLVLPNWYCYYLSPNDCNRLLKDAPRGAFVIRDVDLSDKENQKTLFALSVRGPDRPEHFLIHTRIFPDYRPGTLKVFYFIHERNVFANLNSLVDYYKVQDCLGTLLVRPLVIDSSVPKPRDLVKREENSWELQQSCIEFVEKGVDGGMKQLGPVILGEGNFGKVYQARWYSNPMKRTDPVPCAVKVVKEGNMDIEAFVLEANMMRKFDHHQNLCRLYGVRSLQEPIWIVTELVDGGSLKDHLQKVYNDDNQKYTDRQLTQFISQVAAGMAYLEKVKFVHRDLAARNVLITSDAKICKVCDFGLTRFLEEEGEYMGSPKQKVPVKWTAPEAYFEPRRFTSKSDVWAFGVCSWEITSWGESPFKDMKPKDVPKQVLDGLRLSKPQDCEDWLWIVIKQCWEIDPEKRMTFKHINKLIRDFAYDNAMNKLIEELGGQKSSSLSSVDVSFSSSSSSSGSSSSSVGKKIAGMNFIKRWAMDFEENNEVDMMKKRRKKKGGAEPGSKELRTAINTAVMVRNVNPPEDDSTK